jgi:hypothetical protein
MTHRSNWAAFEQALLALSTKVNQKYNLGNLAGVNGTILAISTKVDELE